MISTNQKSQPAGSALLQSFRFNGLEVGEWCALPPPGGSGLPPCDVLLALDFAGSVGGSLADRLADARQRLGTDGVLLLALPNRFGLRFWSGCPEPATGRLFATLTGPGAMPAAAAEAAGRPRSFVSRRELAEALAEAGFTALEWFFAVPQGAEARRSGSLISEQLVAAAPELAADLASAQPSADALRPRLDLFPEALVYRELARAGLFAEFANYFLVAAAPSPATPGSSIWPRLRPSAAEVGWHFAAERRQPIATVFERGAEGITVGKCRTDGGADPGVNAAGAYVWSAPERTTLAPGEPLRLRLQEHLVASRNEPFLDEFVRFAAAIRERFGGGEDLAAEALDATLVNATRDQGGVYHLFDLEWRAPAGVPLSWWLLRNVLSLLEMRGPRFAQVATGADLYATLCQRLAIVPRLAVDLAREAEFGAAARNLSPESGMARLTGALEQPWPVPVALGLDTAELRSAFELGAAHQQLVADYHKLELWAEETQQKYAATESAYRRLESWAMEVQQANQTVLTDYRKLAEWANGLQAELQQRDSGHRS
ncbi:MAG: hypothetical protein ABI689_02390 [Thermoanaerobaculia bacterium]